MRLDDTIVAISTPPGRGAIGVVRLSGPQAKQVGLMLTGTSQSDVMPNRARLLKLYHPETSALIDECLLTFFQSPRSFTGEDVVELSCHGSRMLLAEVVDAAVKLGVRPATPGEFSLRAVLNGKMDLTQAEAIRDLIDSTTRWQARLALGQLQGSLSRRLGPLKQSVVDQIVQLESALEFVEERLNAQSLERVAGQLHQLVASLSQIAQSFDLGRRIREGVTVAIVGRPNVGKSSLFNALLQRERAIVTEFPGTTRDALAETIELGNIPVTVIDTAGLRETVDQIEQIGVERSYAAIADADALVIVLDRSLPFSEEDRAIVEQLRERSHLVVLNKVDIPANAPIPEWHGLVHVSAKTGEGLDALTRELVELLMAGEEAEASDAILTNARHHRLVTEAVSSIRESLSAIEQGFSEEVALVGLYSALRSLGDLTGETLVEDILGQIFSTFCIGK